MFISLFTGLWNYVNIEEDVEDASHIRGDGFGDEQDEGSNCMSLLQRRLIH